MPPVVASLSVVTNPEQTENTPEIGDGDGLIIMFFVTVAEQPILLDTCMVTGIVPVTLKE